MDDTTAVATWLVSPEGRAAARRWVRRVGLPLDVAEDVAQEVLVRTEVAVRRGEALQNPQAWANRLGAFAARDVLRGSLRGPRPATEVDEPVDITGPVDDVEAVAVGADLAGGVRRAVAARVARRPWVGAWRPAAPRPGPTGGGGSAAAGPRPGPARGVGGRRRPRGAGRPRRAGPSRRRGGRPAPARPGRHRRPGARRPPHRQGAGGRPAPGGDAARRARSELVALAGDVDRDRYGPRPQVATAEAGFALRPRSPEVAAAAAPMAAPAAAAARLRVVQPVVVDRTHLPPGAAADDVGAVLAGVAEVEVQLAGGAGKTSAWWARATAPDGTTLALAPIVAAGDDAVARLLVPPSAVGALEVDLTAEPGAPRPSVRLRAVERAVLLGRAAARASRLGLPAANARWTACGQTWAEAGDEARAERATDRLRSQEAGPPLAVDHLLEG